MSLIFNEWPEDRREIAEIWLTKIEGESVITQASLDFSREEAEKKFSILAQNLPGVLVTLLGPFRL